MSPQPSTITDTPTGPGPLRARARRALRRKRTWIVGVPVVLLVAGFLAAYSYNRYLNAHVPPPLSFGDTLIAQPQQHLDGGTPDTGGSASTGPAVAKVSHGSTPTAAARATERAASDGSPTSATRPATSASKAPAASPIEGSWKTGSGSVAGYRIGYSSPVGGGTRVGRTDAVTGEMRIVGTTVQTARFSVDMRKVTSDGGSTCDDHVRQLMDTDHYPYETFVLSTPIELKSVPADGKQVTVNVTGKLTLRGVTRSTTFPLTARRNGGRIEVLGSIRVNRDDYKIPDANEPGFTIDKNGTIELLLAFDRQS